MSGSRPRPLARRVQILESAGVITGRVALVDPEALGLGVTVMVHVHERSQCAWLDRFAAAIEDLPEIIEAYRISGEIDYTLKVVVPSIDAYDDFYRRLIGKVELYDVRSVFVMEEIKRTTALPLHFLPGTGSDLGSGHVEQAAEEVAVSALTKPGEWTFGIQLPIQTLTRTLVDEWEDAATVDDLVAITKAADQHGYDFVGVCDHVAIPDNDYASKMTTTWYDTISTLRTWLLTAAHPSAVRRVDRGVPPSAANGEGVRHPRSSLGWAGDPGGRCRARGGGVRCPRCRLPHPRKRLDETLRPFGGVRRHLCQP